MRRVCAKGVQKLPPPLHKIENTASHIFKEELQDIFSPVLCCNVYSLPAGVGSSVCNVRVVLQQARYIIYLKYFSFSQEMIA